MDGSEESFRAFVTSRVHALNRAAWLLTGDVHLAEDLVQTALAKAASRWEKITAGGNPEPYVRRILYTEHVSWWRRRKLPEVLRGDVPEQRQPEVDVPLRVTMLDALTRLTPKQRTVLVLRYYEDLSESQTADILGVSIGTVRSQTRYALNRLRVLAPELAEMVGVPE